MTDDRHEDDDGQTRAADLLCADGVRVLADRCATCIFRPGNLMRLHPGRAP